MKPRQLGPGVVLWGLRRDMESGGEINTADSHWDRECEDTVGGAERQIKAMSASAPTAEQTASSWM